MLPMVVEQAAYLAPERQDLQILAAVAAAAAQTLNQAVMAGQAS